MFECKRWIINTINNEILKTGRAGSIVYSSFTSWSSRIRLIDYMYSKCCLFFYLLKHCFLLWSLTFFVKLHILQLWCTWPRVSDTLKATDHTLLDYLNNLQSALLSSVIFYLLTVYFKKGVFQSLCLFNYCVGRFPWNVDLTVNYNKGEFQKSSFFEKSKKKKSPIC